MIQRLKENVESKFGRKIIYQRECNELSISIQEETEQVLSNSTLRRFFGFLATNSNPSLATLDILSEYCGYKDWEDFKISVEAERSPKEFAIGSWNKAKQKANSISHKNKRLLEQKGVSQLLTEIDREVTHQLFPTFFNSQATVLPILAPSGYGKTALLLNWYNSYSTKREFKHDIILLIPALFLQNWVDKYLFLESWLLSILDIPSSGLFDKLKNEKSSTPGRFILLIDALDQLSDSGQKQAKIYSAIEQLVSSFPPQNFKLIISSRLPSWSEFTKQASTIDDKCHKPVLFSSGFNIPKLNSHEIQTILNRTLDEKKEFRVQLEQLPPTLRRELSFPFYLKLYTESLGTTTKSRILNREDLITTLIKDQVYSEQYPNEKMDILMEIVSLSHKNKSFGTVKFNDLRKNYPIHLKLSGNYFIAYNQLLLAGIVSEVLSTTKFGLYTKQVFISNSSVWEFLLVQYLIEENQGISFDLFKTIEKEYGECTCLANLILLLFALSYKLKLVPQLKRFFELSDYTLNQVFNSDTFLHILTSDEQLKNQLINHYASLPNSKKYFIGRFKDLSGLASTNRVIPISFINSAVDKNIKVFAQTLLNISNSYRLNFKWIEEHLKEEESINPPSDFNPLIKGSWYSCNLISDYITKQNTETAIKNIDRFTKTSLTKNSADQNDFELGLALGLIFSKQFSTMQKRIENHLGNKINHPETAEEYALAIYLFYALWRTTGELPRENIAKIRAYLPHIPLWIEIQTKIVAHSLLSFHSFTVGEIEQGYNLFRDAIEMSNHSKYRVFELILLRDLYETLSSIGETENAEQSKNLAHNIAQGYHFDLSLLY